jgi:hypothetical protein
MSPISSSRSAYDVAHRVVHAGVAVEGHEPDIVVEVSLRRRRTPSSACGGAERVIVGPCMPDCLPNNGMASDVRTEAIRTGDRRQTASSGIASSNRVDGDTGMHHSVCGVVG